MGLLGDAITFPVVVQDFPLPQVGVVSLAAPPVLPESCFDPGCEPRLAAQHSLGGKTCSGRLVTIERLPTKRVTCVAGAGHIDFVLAGEVPTM